MERDRNSSESVIDCLQHRPCGCKPIWATILTPKMGQADPLRFEDVKQQTNTALQRGSACQSPQSVPQNKQRLESLTILVSICHRYDTSRAAAYALHIRSKRPVVLACSLLIP